MPVKRFPSDASAAQIRSLTPDPPIEAVAEIIRDVRLRGDDAVAELEARFGSAASGPVRVEQSEIDAAPRALEIDLLTALKLAITNVRDVATAQIADGAAVELPQGQTVEYRSVPIRRAGAYVPGGKGSYPSTAVMTLATAVAAGVDSICVVSPAREDGKVDPAVLAVCSMLGVDEVYAIGGAQAIAALAYGTATIPAVDVIVGPGNAFVSEAKRQVVGTVGIDGIAGPSELVVVADSTADPEAVALDLLAQGEHGPDSLVVLISSDPDLLDAVVKRSEQIEAEMAVVLATDMQRAIALADSIAPEHLQIISRGDSAEELGKVVRNAGCLFVGANAATAFGDYVAGSNHVLPTGGAARFTSALSVATFRRRMAEVSIPDGAVNELADAGATIARAEGFPLHGQSMEIRKKS
jgi:histidinol dehydrogenase